MGDRALIAAPIRWKESGREWNLFGEIENVR